MTNEIRITKQDSGERLDISDIVEHTSVDIIRHDPENPIPHSEIAGRPDAGFGGIRVKFTLSISRKRDNELDEGDRKIPRLFMWVSGDQTPGLYGFGVFSLMHQELMDITKTAKAGDNGVGYKLVNLHLEVSHQIPDRITGYLDMQLDGKVTQNG